MSINFKGLNIYVPRVYISANKSIDLICNEWDLDPNIVNIEPVDTDNYNLGFILGRNRYLIETLPAIACFENMHTGLEGESIYDSEAFTAFVKGVAPDVIGPYKRFKKANMIYYYRFRSAINEDCVKEILENGRPTLPEPAPIETQRIHLSWLAEPILGVPVQREPAETYTLREVHRWDRIMRGLQEPDES